MRKLILIFLSFLLSSSLAWATFPNYTVAPTGADFTTLGAACTDLTTNHASTSTAVTITISGSWASADTSTCTITTMSGTTGGAGTTPISISTTGSARNTTGKMPTGSGPYWIKPASGDAIDFTQYYYALNLDGLSFDMSTSNGTAVKVLNYLGNSTWKNNLVKITSGHGLVQEGNGFATPENYIYNNVVYGNGTSNTYGLGLQNHAAGNVDFYSNTVYNVGYAYGVNQGGNGGTCVFSNNIASNNTNGSIDGSSFYCTGTKNICDNSSQCTAGSLTSGTNSATSYTSYYTSPSTGDFSVKDSNSILSNAGTALGTPYNVDIIGTSRPQYTNYSIGAFELIYSAPVTTSKIGGGTIGGATIG